MAGKKKKKVSEEEAGAEPAGPKSGKAKSVLLHGVLVLIGAFGYKFLLTTAPSQIIIAPPIEGGVAVAGDHGIDCSAINAGGGGEAPAAGAPHARAQSSAAAPGGSADLSSQTINLADGHYLKVGITLELGKTVVLEEFMGKTAKASDVVLNYFSTKSMADLTNDKHAAIKVELTCLLQNAYAEPVVEGEPAHATEPAVKNVLFREFLTS
ncbi:MAG: flagellar basal body-associated FliL family protein [Acidimicrobiales bacterium]